MEVRTLENCFYSRILKHMAMTVDTMIDGDAFPIPAPVEFFVCLLVKKKILTQTGWPGFKLPRSVNTLIPGETSVAGGMQLVRATANSPQPRQNGHLMARSV